MIDIGGMPYPMYSTKGLYTYIRISPLGKMILGQNITIRNGANIGKRPIFRLDVDLI